MMYSKIYDIVTAVLVVKKENIKNTVEDKFDRYCNRYHEILWPWFSYSKIYDIVTFLKHLNIAIISFPQKILTTITV